MYKYLLTGCAAAALTMGASVASAQDFKVTLSGEAKFEANFASQDKDTNLRGTEFRNRFRLVVNPEAKGLDGALTYGATVKMKFEKEFSTFEASYTYLKGAFGSVYLGQVASYNDDKGVTRPADFVMEDDGAYGYVKANNGAYSSTDATKLDAWRRKVVDIMGQSTKVRYDSPVISGLTLAVAYTPTTSSNNWDYTRSDNTDLQDSYEVGVKFDSTDKSIADKFGAALLQASFGYQGASSGKSALEDYNGYQAGVRVGYQDFTFGGHYVYQGKSGLAKVDQSKKSEYAWGLGAQYKFTPALTVGIAYNYAEKDAQLGATNSNTGLGVKKSSQIQTGVSYVVARGLTAYADYQYLSSKNTLSNVSDDASVFTLATKLIF